MKESLLRQQNNLQAANERRAPIYGVGGENKIFEAGKLKRKNVEQNIDSANLMAAQANLLSTKLHREVKAESVEIENAVKELERIMGPAFMEQMVDGLAMMAEGGASGYAGLFKTEIDKATN